MTKRIKNGEFSFSPVAVRLLDAAVDIQQNPDATDKAYMARQLVQCGRWGKSLRMINAH